VNLRRLLSRLGLVALGLVAGVLVAEGIGRLDRFTRGRELLFPNLDGYPRDLYVVAAGMNFPNPDFKGEVTSFGYAIRPRFNQWATRGPEPTEGARRWIAVGDSVTLALQVEEEQTFSALLAQAIDREVLNAGVDGYSTWKETIRAAQLAGALGAEGIVVTFFTGNDYYDNHQQVQGRSSSAVGPFPRPGQPKFPIHPAPPRAPTPAYQKWLHDHSVLWAWVTVLQKQQQTRTGTDRASLHFKEELTIFTSRAREALSRELPHTVPALRDLAATGERLGARVVVAVVPPAFAMSTATAASTLHAFGLDEAPDIVAAQTTAVRAAQQAGLEVCDMGPPLTAAAASGAHPYLAFDGHLSVAGHEIVATELARCIGSPSP